jgi:hypothetical protein
MSSPSAIRPTSLIAWPRVRAMWRPPRREWRRQSRRRSRRRYRARSARECGAPLAMQSCAARMTSASTQPPETEPAKRPFSSTIKCALARPGAEPHVSTTVAMATPRPSARHCNAVARSSLSDRGSLIVRGNDRRFSARLRSARRIAPACRARAGARRQASSPSRQGRLPSHAGSSEPRSCRHCAFCP